MQAEEILRKILLPIDDSVPSHVAMELAAFIAKRFESKVTLLHAISHEFLNPQFRRFAPEAPEYVSVAPTGEQGAILAHLPDSPPRSAAPEAVVNEITEWYRQRAEEIIAESVNLFKEEGVQVDQKIVEHADPAEAIIEETQEGDYDLVTMGYGGEIEHKPHLGSTTQKVLRHVQTPVLIAREKRQMKRILVPFDGSEKSQKALKYGASLAEKSNAELTLLYIQELGLLKIKPDVAKKIGDNILSEAISQVKGVKLNQRLESGDPAEMIVQLADKENYDLIVMGNKGHGAVMRFLMGSVAEHVVHYANTSVLMVK